jgi:hypothetical protein
MGWIALGVLGIAVVFIALVRARRRRSRDVTVRFDMVLPSKWAAELTQRVLETESTRSRTLREGGRWLCRVAIEGRVEPDRCERLRAHFDQIASARGGDCSGFAVIRGRDVATYGAGRDRRAKG